MGEREVDTLHTGAPLQPTSLLKHRLLRMEVLPSDRCPLLSPHTALAAGTLHRPQPRTRRLSTGGCAPSYRCGYPSGTPSGSYVPRGRCRPPIPGLSRSPPWGSACCPLAGAAWLSICGRRRQMTGVYRHRHRPRPLCLLNLRARTLLAALHHLQRAHVVGSVAGEYVHIGYHL